jgi:uncharacterized protein
MTGRSFLHWGVFGVLVGCAQPVPSSKKDFIGTWQGPEMRLTVTAAGKVDYERHGAIAVTVTGSRLVFEESNLIVGVWPFDMTLRVDEPPHGDGAVWKMKLDGVELARAENDAAGRVTERQWLREAHSQCTEGRADSCRKLADFYGQGFDAPQDLRKAAEYLRLACNAGSARACADLGALQRASLEGAGDSTSRVALWQKACDLGNVGCGELASAYLAGDGVQRDPAKAVDILEKACNADVAVACWNLAALNDRGEAISQNRPRAALLAAKACVLGEVEGCSAAPQLIEAGVGVAAEAVALTAALARACEGGEAQGCYELGLAHGLGLGVTKDLVKASRLHETACKGERLVACSALGKAHLIGEGVPQDAVKARTVLAKACSGGKQGACFDLANCYLQGTGGPPDLEKARALFEAACSEGLTAACNNLGMMYRTGTGVPQDPRRAWTLFKRACEIGNHKACGNAEQVEHNGR